MTTSLTAHSDLRGADLRRRRLEFMSLASARLDGADLTDATLTCVDLSNASMTDAVLNGTKLLSVDASRVDLTRASLSHSYWNVCDLSRADLTGAGLEHAFVRNSNVALATFDGTDLTWAKLAACDCSQASFRGSLLDRTLTMGSRFKGADFAGARRFFRSREIVAEVLRREVGADFELLQMVGAVIAAPDWCYAQWKAWLDLNPSRLRCALAIFALYPESGCREALLEGYSGDPVGG
jgi:uncharacterized protein YjbI with pentapeptide repeats